MSPEPELPAVIFDRLPEDHVVQMFVTINAKHTRLNPSHLVSLAGRRAALADELRSAIGRSAEEQVTRVHAPPVRTTVQDLEAAG